VAEEEQPIRFEFDVSWDDLRSVYLGMWAGDGWRRRWLGEYSWRTYVLGFAMCIGATVLLFALIQSWVALVAGAAVFGFTGAYDGTRRRATTWDRAWEQFKAAPMAANLVGRQVMEFDPTGVTRRTATTENWRPWAGISRVTGEFGGIVVTCGVEHWLLPESFFPGASEKALLLEHLRGWKDAPHDSGPRIADGELVSPPFNLHEGHLYRAAALSARSFVPSRGSVVWGGINALSAVAWWPWWAHPPVSWLGALGAAFAFWTFVGSRFFERWSYKKLARQQMDDESLRPGFSGVTLGISAEGLTEVSPRSSSQEHWPAIWEVVIDETAAFFRTSSATIYVLPAAAFPTSDAYFDFVEKALEYRRAALATAA